MEGSPCTPAARNVTLLSTGSGRLRTATTKEPPTATRVKDKAEGEEIVAATKKEVKREREERERERKRQQAKLVKIYSCSDGLAG